MTLKEFFTMVQTYLGKSPDYIQQNWDILITGSNLGDWEYYHTCWFVDGEYPWDNVVQNRVNQRYMKGWSTKDPFAIDHPSDYYPKPIKPRKERRILNA